DYYCAIWHSSAHVFF
nr:immunoglobulin light chain junction region [Macaca mulatta]MOX80841.1 immunoglobulin light chain junction region [Macaca mulatta]MOX83328.1 immunoglobulin light chain junction region [Macaca mulatta]